MQRKRANCNQMVRFIHHGPQILPLRASITTEISNVKWNKHCSHTDIYEMMMHAYDWKRNVSQMAKESKRVNCQQGEKKSRAAKEQIHLNHSGPFPIVFFSFSLHPPPFFSLPVLYSSSGAIFPPLLSLLSSLFFCPLCVPLSACVWWYQSSRTPPLTDSSLDGTLLCTVQCTAILPQWAADLWWMDGITPSSVSGTCQTEGGRGGEPLLEVSLWGWIVPYLCLGNMGPTGISQISISDMDGLCDVRFSFFFFVCAKILYRAWDVSPRGLNHYMSLWPLWCPSSPLLLWGLLQSGGVVYITVQIVTFSGI